MYLIETEKETFELLAEHLGKNAAASWDGAPVNSRQMKEGYRLYGYEFKLRRNAIKFAIWASGWATSVKNDGTMAGVYPMFDF